MDLWALMEELVAMAYLVPRALWGHKVKQVVMALLEQRALMVHQAHGGRQVLTVRQVRQVRQIIEGLGHEVATPDEARQILQLKGQDKVRF